MSRMNIIDRLVVPTYDNEAYAHTGRVEIDPALCNGCGMCVAVCPGKALLITGHGKDKRVCMEPDFPQCMSCNDCAAMCDRGAISVSMTYDFGFRFKILDRSAMKPPRRFTKKSQGAKT
jgi:formate hydrogenlyase subunit 6/NADH:ubiquinone oxidoreductase subunit I